MKISILLTFLILLFEIFLQRIDLLGYISLLFIMTNLFFWFKRYKEAFFIGVAGGVLLDLFLQDNLGKSIFSSFFPLLVLSLIDALLHVESKLTRFGFSIVCLTMSIIIHDFIFNLFMFKFYVDPKEILIRLVTSAIVLAIFIVIFQKPLSENNEVSDKKLRSKYL